MKLFNILRHISNIVIASGKKRIFYTIINALVLAAAFASSYGIYYFISHFQDSAYALIGGAIGIMLCTAIAISSFLEGVVSQLVLTVMSFVGIFVSKERLNNFIAFSLTIIIYIIVIIVINLLI